MTYDEAISALYQAPHAAFVSERKRLSTELTKAGHKPQALLLAKHTRPSVSTWVVNQLWWREQAAMKSLFASGAQVRAGDLSAVGAHRQATAELVTRAATLLEEAGHSTTDATLRKVNANLAALAVAGGFEPDPTGALRNDRDPPGFEAMADSTIVAHPQSTHTGEGRDAAAERARAEAAEAERRAAQARERARAERAKLIAAVSDAKAQLEQLERKRDEQQSALAATTTELERIKATAIVLQAQLNALAEDSAG